MPGIVLEDEAGEYLGALLVAGDAKLAEGPAQRDSILTGVPLLGALASHPLGVLIQLKKHVERPCEIDEGQGGALVLRVGFSATDALRVTLAADGSRGTWSLEL